MAGEVAFEDTGPRDGTPVILSSSLGTTSAMWTAQVESLSDRFRVIAYDHRGHGGSPVAPGPYHLDDLATDVLAMMDHLSVEKAHFAGISLGGMVGMWLGANAGERLDRLALLCTFAEVASPEMWRDRADLVREAGTAAISKSSVERWFSDGFRERLPRHRPALSGDDRRCP